MLRVAPLFAIEALRPVRVANVPSPRRHGGWCLVAVAPGNQPNAPPPRHLAGRVNASVGHATPLHLRAHVTPRRLRVNGRTDGVGGAAHTCALTSRGAGARSSIAMPPSTDSSLPFFCFLFLACRKRRPVERRACVTPTERLRPRWALSPSSIGVRGTVTVRAHQTRRRRVVRA